MNLPPTPMHSHSEFERGNLVHYHTTESLEAYGKLCAEAMRDKCAAELQNNYGLPGSAEIIRALEIKT